MGLLAILGLWCLYGIHDVSRLNRAVQVHRLSFYIRSICIEALLLAFVLAGVRRARAPFRFVLGQHWRSFRQVLRDIGVAAVFWIVTWGLLQLLGWLLRIGGNSRDLTFMLPHRAVELAGWIALSIAAGICEEAIFRGYLQQQFLALTQNVAISISLSAVVFGGAHAYQGFRKVVLISLYGAMFGALAHWRGSVRPGMIAHGWQDSLAGVTTFLTTH